MKRKNIDLTEGNISRKVILFAIPLLIGALVQQLYNTVDLIFAGNYIGTNASAAIGASGQLAVCLIGFFGGMGVGSSIVISRFFGAKDPESVSKAIHNTLALSLAGGAVIMVIGWFFSPVYLKLVNTPIELREMANGYLRIYFLSVTSIILYNLGGGILRAVGDSQSTLTAQLYGGLMNVAMDYLFIRVFENGINGVAWATLISQSFAAGIIIYRLTKLDPAYAFKVKKLRFDGPILKEVIALGVPAGLQTLVIALSNVMAHYHINSLGRESIAAFTAYYKIELLIYSPIMALGQATMTFVGQNRGAGNFERVRKGTKTILTMSVCLAFTTGILGLLAGKYLFGAFNKDVEVIKMGCKLLKVTFPFYWFYSFLQILGDSMRGMGKTREPMLIITLNICLIRTALLFLIVPRFHEIRGVGMTYPITWCLTAICMIVLYVRFWKRFDG